MNDRPLNPFRQIVVRGCYFIPELSRSPGPSLGRVENTNVEFELRFVSFVQLDRALETNKCFTGDSSWSASAEECM